MPTVLVTGASRGLGFEFARQFAAAGWRVLAACRDPDRAAALSALATAAPGRVSVHRLDVADGAAIERLAGELADVPIDVLVNNAGIGWPPQPPHDEFGRTDYAGWAAAMATNVLAPMKMCEAFVEHVARSERRTIAMISSRLGSIALATHDDEDYVYRSTKAALNMLTKMLAGKLAGRGIVTVALAPGWVRTDMGGADAALSPEESIAGMRRVIDGLGPDDSGRFLNHLGEPLPW